MVRKDILKKFPWLKNKGRKYIVMGDDLDAALATVLFLHLNPCASLLGIYHKYSSIYFSKKIFKTFTDLINCDRVIWIDLDIYFKKCFSLGHHIVRYDDSNILRGFCNSCNINEMFKRSVTKEFKKKYPLGTIHFLMWLYKVEIPAEEYADCLIWLADSSFINAQSHRFAKNVKEWLKIFYLQSFYKTFKEVDTKSFEEKMKKLQEKMKEFGFEKGSGQVKSRFLELYGFQCQPHSIPNDIIKLLNFISDITGWSFKNNQICLDELCVVFGKRSSVKFDKLQEAYGTIDNFLNKNNVFSYVFTYKNKINYTIFDNL